MPPTKSLRWVTVFCVLAVGLAPLAASAQTSAAPVVIHQTTTKPVQGADGLPGLLMGMYFTVHDQAGEVVATPDIDTAQIALDDGSRYNAQFGEPGEPWEIAIVMDASGNLYSWQAWDTYKTVRQAAFQALAQGPQAASYSVVKFAEKSEVVFKSGEVGKAATAINNLRAAAGHACLADALYETLNLLGATATSRRAMVVFSASVDDCSRHTPQEVIQVANANSVQIYVVGLSGYPFDEKMLTSLATSTGGAFDQAVKEQQAFVFRKTMLTIASQRLAQATLYPLTGNHKAQLQVVLKSGLNLQSAAVSFKADQDYVQPPQIRLLGEVQSGLKTIQLNLAVTNPAAVGKLEVIISSVKTGEGLINVTPSVSDTVRPLVLPADQLTLEEEYNVTVKAVNKAGTALPDVLGKFKYAPPPVSVQMSLTGLPTITKPEFVFHVEGQNLEEAAAKYKYWLAAEKVDGDIGGTTREVVLTDTLRIDVTELKAGTYRVFLQALDTQNALVAETSYSTIQYTPPTLTDKLILRLKDLAADTALIALMSVAAVGLLMVVLWLVAPRGGLGRNRRVDLVLQESSRKGRSAAPPPPPVAAPRAQPPPAAPRAQAPRPQAAAAPRPQAPLAAAPRPAARGEPTPTILVEAVRPPAAPAPRPGAPPHGRLVVQHLPVGIQIPQTIEVTKSPFTLGRVSADLTVNDARVSRKHAVITLEQGGFYIQDAASANGTLLNGAKLPPDKKVPLPPGTVIGLGPEILFKFEVLS